MAFSKLKLNGRNLLIIIFLLLVAGWFYWFQYRPNEIKSYCSKTAGDITHKRDFSVFGLRVLDEREKFYNYTYTYCLHNSGL